MRNRWRAVSVSCVLGGGRWRHSGSPCAAGFVEEESTPCDQSCVRPPSAASSTPVMYDASSKARKSDCHSNFLGFAEAFRRDLLKKRFAEGQNIRFGSCDRCYHSSTPGAHRNNSR